MNNLDTAVINLIREVNQHTLARMKEPYRVATKTNYNDLVTTVDKENERYIDQALSKIDPGCRILSEEGFGTQNITDLKGHVWIVDPIDGTLNFVKQHNQFGIMLALYVDGQPQNGYIMDCMNNHLYHGGRGQGVYVDNTRLASPQDCDLRSSLVAISSSLILDDVHRLPAVAQAASGLRMYGSAAMEMAGVITGALGGYVSHLRPWDLAAGRILAEELGLVVKSIDGTALDVLSSNFVLIATRQVSQDILQIID